MTSSRSIISVVVALATLVGWLQVADAGTRKRIVVLDFDGPKAEKFHDDLVRMIKKAHTVVPTDKWNGTAEELDAGTPTEKNIKKVAKKLKIDGVVTGKIEKRRDEYILRLKLHAGTTGEMAGNSIETKAEGPRIDGKAQRDIKDELIGAIDDLESNHGGGGDDDADKPSKHKKASDDDDDGDKPVKAAKKKTSSDDDDEDAPKHGKFSKSDDDSKGGDRVGKKAKKPSDDDEDAPKAKKTAKKDDDEDSPKAKKTASKDDDEDSPKAKKAAKKDDDDSGDDDKPAKKKKVAAKGDDDSGGEANAEADTDDGANSAVALSPSGRAVDATLGISLTGRNLSFSYRADVAKPPPGYKQAIPVAGAVLDATIFPLAIGHKRHDALAGLGVELLYDKVISIKSQKLYVDNGGNNAVATQATSESRLGLGAVFRYPLKQNDPMATVVGGKLTYGMHDFSIAQKLPNGMPVDIPSVTYKYFEPSAFINYPMAPKITLNANLGVLLVNGLGQIGQVDQYGQASILGFELDAGGDYMLSKNLFARALIHVETYAMTFKNDPMGQTNMRDSDPTTQDVGGARDTYFGGAVTVGYLY